jgi:hypothetical protein
VEEKVSSWLPRKREASSQVLSQTVCRAQWGLTNVPNCGKMGVMGFAKWHGWVWKSRRGGDDEARSRVQRPKDVTE